MIKRIDKFFSSKKVTFNTTTIIMTLSVVGILLILNLIAGSLGWKIDLSSDKVNSISKESIEFIKTVDEEVDIIVFFKDTISEIRNTLEDYERLGDNIRIKYLDPDVNPTIANKYNTDGRGLDANTIVVESERRWRKLRPEDLFETDHLTGQVYSKVEQKITGAIAYVIEENEDIIYMLQGHGEEDLTSYPTISQALKDTNFITQDLNLLSVDSIPQDASIVAIISPKRDIGENEKTIIEEYLKQGGNLLVFIDPGVEFENLNSLLEKYNILVNNDLVVEGDRTRVVFDAPLYLKPNIQYTELTRNLAFSNLNIVFPVSRSLSIKDETQENLKVETLATTSSLSWGKINLSDLENLQKQEGDAQGPLNLALMAQKNLGKNSGENTRIVIFGNSSFISESSFRQIGAVGNYDLFVNTVSWLSEREEPISIGSKLINIEYFRVDGTQALWILIIVTLLPLLAMSAGIIIWFMRRKL